MLGGNSYTESLGGLWALFWVSRVNPRVPDRTCPGDDDSTVEFYG